MIVLGDLRAQGGELSFRLRDERRLILHVERGYAAGALTRLRDVELDPLRGQHAFERGALRTGAGLPQCGGDHVAGEREARRFEFESLIVDLRGERFEGASVAAEDIERIRDVHARVVKREWAGARYARDAK